MAHWISLEKLLWILHQTAFLDLNFFGASYCRFTVLFWWSHVSLLPHDSGSPCLSICAFKEAVASSNPWGPLPHGWVYTGAWYDIGSGVAGAKYGSTWQHKVHQRHNVSSALATGVPRINSCMSLVRTAWSLQWLQELLRFWVVPASVAASDQGRNCWPCEHTRLWGPAAGAYVMAGARCRYTELSEGQCRQQGPGTAISCKLAATGALNTSMPSHGCTILPWVCELQ